MQDDGEDEGRQNAVSPAQSVTAAEAGGERRPAIGPPRSAGSRPCAAYLYVSERGRRMSAATARRRRVRSAGTRTHRTVHHQSIGSNRCTAATACCSQKLFKVNIEPEQACCVMLPESDTNPVRSNVNSEIPMRSGTCGSEIFRN